MNTTMTMNEVRECLIGTEFYSEKDLDNATPEDLVSWYISTVDPCNPQHVCDLANDITWAENLLSDRLKEQGHLLYEGMVNVICTSVPAFLWECYTHFLSEGLEEPEVRAECNRLRKMFVELGHFKKTS